MNYDDGDYVYENPYVRSGLTLNGIGWAFTHVHAQYWHPLTTISHMLDCQVFGLQPWGHHLTNIMLHAAATILLFFALLRLTATGRSTNGTSSAGIDRPYSHLWPSAFVAALFAIHPLRVESVAWVSERKDVLSGVFFMLTLLAYASYAREDRNRRRWYLSALSLFALGLMCKPTLVTLPFILLLLDYWPLARCQRSEVRSRWSIVRSLVVEKIPFFVLSAASCVVTILIQRESVATIQGLTPYDRIANSIVSYVVYLGQTVYPAHLAVLYPYPKGNITVLEVVLGLLLLATASTVFWLWRRTYPFLLIGWLWFLGMLIPMIGIVQVGSQSHADRYTYLPGIGLAMVVAYGATDLVRRWPAGRVIVVTLGSISVLLLTTRSYLQASYWQNGETLWQHTLSITSNNYIAHNDLANSFLQKGELADAIVEARRSLAIAPNFAEAHITLGNSLFRSGLREAAATEYQLALHYRPDFADVRTNLGSVLLQQGKVDEAIAEFQKALQAKPNFAELHSNLGNALLRKGDVNAAIDHYRRAIELDSNFPQAHYNLGSALEQKGQLDEALAHYQTAITLKPDYAEAEYRFGNALLQRHQIDDAIVHYQKSLAIRSDNAEAQYNLAKAFASQGKYDEAIKASQAAVRLRPNYAEAYNNLGCYLGAIGKTDEALRQFNEALRVNPNSVDAHYNLGRLLAQLGRRDEAVAQLTEAVRLKPEDSEAKHALSELGVPK